MKLNKNTVSEPSKAKVYGLRADIQKYERLKREWIEAHPEATSNEYQAAMTRLACECGI